MSSKDSGGPVSQKVGRWEGEKVRLFFVFSVPALLICGRGSATSVKSDQDTREVSLQTLADRFPRRWEGGRKVGIGALCPHSVGIPWAS